MTTVPGTAMTRAVVRLVEPGSDVMCVFCNRQVKFAAKVHPRQVIANVYEHGVWKHIEHYHAECYEEAGEPYGAAVELRPGR